MSETSSTIISKVWGMCGPLRDDGVSYGDYLEQQHGVKIILKDVSANTALIIAIFIL